MHSAITQLKNVFHASSNYTCTVVQMAISLHTIVALGDLLIL